MVVSFEEIFEENELDAKLLYVSMTRALHHLHLIGRQPVSFYLDEKTTKDKVTLTDGNA